MLPICVLKFCRSFDVDLFQNARAFGDWVFSPVSSPDKVQSYSEQDRFCHYPIVISRTRRKICEGAARTVPEYVDPWKS